MAADKAEKRTPKTRARKRQRNAPAHVIATTLHCGTRLLHIGEVRLFSAHRVYNACLGVAIARAELCKADPDWEKARAMPPGKPRSEVAVARGAAFNAVREKYDFSER